MQKPFYITTPIFYANANLHMGHAYTTTLVDIIARYHRLKGDSIYFLTGADENAEKIVRSALALGVDTKKYLDDTVVNFKKLFEALNISYDQFIRTSDEKAHWPGAQEMWKRLVAKGDIKKRSYKGFYCVGHEAFITDKDLIEGKCPEHGEPPQEISEENYFFNLSRYTTSIKEKIKSGEFQIIPETRKNEILALLERGLEDVSFSRPANKVSVGIPVPSDSTQKIYVWCDALVNYISALGFGRDDDSLYKKFWPADVHVIGKDILRFHGAIWPGMLLSAGLPLPKQLLVHGFIVSGGKKMSKSLRNVIDPLVLINEYGAEAVRYYLARHISPFEDGDLTLEKFREVYNANLANGLGNLVSRVMKMSQEYLSNANIGIDANDTCPPLPKTASGFGRRANKYEFPKEYVESLNKYDVQSASDFIWKKISEMDERIQTTQPFKLIKTEPEKAKEVIAELVSDLTNIAHMLIPIIPETAEKIKLLVKENKMPEQPLFPRKN